MSIAYYGSAQPWADSGQSPNVTLPTGLQVGWLMLARFDYSSSTAAATPSGWTLIASQANAAISVSYLYYRTVVSGDSGSVFTIPVTGSSNVNSTLTVDVYSGVSTSNPIDTSAISLETNTGTTHTPPPITTSVANELVWTSVSDRGSPPSTSMTAPSNVTQRSQAYENGGGSFAVGTGDAFQTNAGTYTPSAWTGTNSTSNAVMATVALTPGNGSSGTAPTVNATVPVAAAYNDVVSATMAASGNGGATIASYAWTFTTLPNGSNAVLTTPSTSATTFIADAEGTFVINCTVTDSNGLQSSDGGPVIVKAAVYVNVNGTETPVNFVRHP